MFMLTIHVLLTSRTLALSRMTLKSTAHNRRGGGRKRESRLSEVTLITFHLNTGEAEAGKSM